MVPVMPDMGEDRSMYESDLVAVRDTIIRYGRFIDDRDWAGLASIVADTIDLDFTSLWGGAPEKVSGPDLVARWRAMSEGLDTTQHLITGILLTIDGGTVTAVANLVAVHRRDSAPGDSLWTVGGTYRFGLRRADRSWVIDSLSLRVAWVTGNQTVITGTAQ
jgi:SnoaL-like domain